MEPAEALAFVANHFDEFNGPDEALASHKLRRAEQLKLEGEILTFVIERHGGTVQGSTRAELQEWTFNLEDLTSSMAVIGFRQIKAVAKSFGREDALELAREVIQSGKRPSAKELWPDSPKQTRESRSGRLTAALRKLGYDGRVRRLETPDSEDVLGYR